MDRYLVEEASVANAAVGLGIALCEGLSGKAVHAERANEVFRQPLLAQSLNHSTHHRPTTAAATKGTLLLMIMQLTIRQASMFEVWFSAECLFAIGACKVFNMPLLTTGIDTISFDGLVTTSTTAREDTIEAALAERRTFLFVYKAGTERSQTLRANEAVHMPLLANRSHARSLNRLIAVTTSSAKECFVTSSAVGCAIGCLEEAAGAQRITAVAAHKAIDVIRFTQRLHHLRVDWPSACRASALCCFCFVVFVLF